MVLSLQGCMAVGKTTALAYLEENVPYVSVSYETNSGIVDEVRQRGLDKNRYQDFLEIQRLWLRAEVERYEAAREFLCTVMDFGAEEIEFHTINYPKSIGKDWDVEAALGAELESVRRCMPTRILFLDASEETLRRHKEGDATRSRNSFEYYLKHLMPLKREWFSEMDNVDHLVVDGLSKLEVSLSVRKWVDLCIKRYA